MIARGLSSGTICLGCRLRLLHSSARPNLSQSLSQAIRTPSVYQNQRRRWLASEAPARPDERHDEGEKTEDNDWASLERASVDQAAEEQAYRDYLDQDDPLPDLRERHSDRRGGRPRRGSRDHGSRGADRNGRPIMRQLSLKTKHLSGTKLLTETSANLGLDMLGKPAYAIVMKDGGKYQPKRNIIAAEKLEERKDDLKAIEAVLGDHRAPATAAEVHENIDGLRPPKTELVLQQKDFDRIQTGLEEGFLKEQLLQYISTFEPDRNTEATTDSVETLNTVEEQKSNLEDQYQWISKAVSWVPLDPYGGVPVHHDRSNLLLHAYLPPDAGPKTRAAVRIMRECWGLQMEEIANGIGECRVTLQTKHFWPLMRGAQDQLRSITKSYLEEGETLATFVPTKEIRIVAPRYKCELVLAEIDGLLGKIRSYTFPVSHVTSDPTMVTEALLDLVGKVTNTHVRFTSTGSRVSLALFLNSIVFYGS